MTGATNEEPLHVEIDSSGVIRARGEIDMAGGPVLERAIAKREGDPPLVIDLGGVTFIDSSGLRSLLTASRRAHQQGSEVVLRSVGPEVSRLLEITGTTSQFVIESHRG